jgi:lysophospholipase L1-like esterase
VTSVLIIGDSFVQGVGATDSFGWAQRVAQAFPEVAFDIRGVGGDTVEKIYARWPDATYDLVILQVGTNDACHRQYKNGPETEPDRYAKYLARIHERLRAPATPLILVGLLFVDETKTVPFSADKSYAQADIEAYDNQLRRFAKRHAVELVSLHDLPRHGRLLSDGLHPSDRGHDYIAHKVLKRLRPILQPDRNALGAADATA